MHYHFIAHDIRVLTRRNGGAELTTQHLQNLRRGAARGPPHRGGPHVRGQSCCLKSTRKKTQGISRRQGVFAGLFGRK
jgi:hypothetical protein